MSESLAFICDDDKDDNLILFREYKKTHSLELRNKILLQYTYIASVIAKKMRGMTQNFAQVEDMVNQGIITLIDCIDKFEVDKGVKFESYAFLRVKGSIIDFIRKQDWVPRRTRQMSKNIKKAYDTLSTQLLREPTNKEIAEYLNLDESELQKNYDEVAIGTTLSFEEVIEEQKDTICKVGVVKNTPESNVMKNELREKLVNSINTLNEKEKLVVTLYYYENLKFKEVAKILEVSESRICQIHTKAIMKLQNNLVEYVRD